MLHTTRAVRKRLDLDRPVERSTILECLEAAVQSPTGSNAQGWQWLVVTDPEKRAALAELYNRGWNVYAGSPSDEEPTKPDQNTRVRSSAQHLADNFHRVPAMLVPCIARPRPGARDFETASVYGSILPGVWSFMLAARERGLGTAWTTIHLMHEEEAAGVLGIPYPEYQQVALITVGYTHGTDFKPAKRPPLETVVRWDTW